MGINNLVRSKAYKNFMSKLYGWGASLVILGALFKIMHYKGAGPMLLMGMGTEALIFFFSAFEPGHVEPDWSLVYPELAGLYAEAQGKKPGEVEETVAVARKSKDPVSAQLDKMLTEAKIGPELIESLGIGLEKMSINAGKLSEISDPAAASNSFVESMEGASVKANQLSETFVKTSEALDKDTVAAEEYHSGLTNAAKSANNLSDAYNKASEVMVSDLGANEEYVNSVRQATTNAQVLADKYAVAADSLTKSVDAIDFSQVDADAYSLQLNKVAENLAALNNLYEVQRQEVEIQNTRSTEMKESVGTFLDTLNESVEFTAKYKEQVDSLAKNVAALNNVYGNMLTAMNVNPNA